MIGWSQNGFNNFANRLSWYSIYDWNQSLKKQKNI